MSSHRRENFIISTPFDADRLLLYWVALVSGRSLEKDTAATSNGSTHLSFTLSNTFCNSIKPQQAHGLVGSIRLLAAPEISLSTCDSLSGQVESWLQITEATLMPLLRCVPWKGVFQKLKELCLKLQAKISNSLLCRRCVCQGCRGTICVGFGETLC